MKKLILIIEIILVLAIILMSALYIPWALDVGLFDGILAIIFTTEVFNIFAIIGIVSLAFYFNNKKIEN